MYIIAFLGAAAPAIIFSLFIGAFAAVGVAFIYKRRGRSRLVPMLIAGILVSVLVFGAAALINAYTTIEYGTVGLVVRFGGLTGQVFEPGLHWKTPFIDKVVMIPTIVQSYETSDSPDLSGANFTDVPVTAQTVDGQQITVKYTVLFRIPADKAVDIVQNVGYLNAVVENNVKAYSRNLSRLWAQNYTANDLYSGEGIFIYERAVHEALAEALKPHGITLENFLVRKVDFSADYVNAIEQKQIAQEAIETAKYESEAAEYEKERQIRLSEAEAKRTTLLAEAEAEKTRLLADAEAYGIEARGKALSRYPTLVQWEFVSNLDNVQWGILPGEGITPLVPIPEFK
jgi:regulator of protease activity HflC (stomatin/prohibitin superfamily)